MKIVIPFTEAFPYGDANTNRLISYAKELVKSGVDVEVHSLQPSVRVSVADKALLPVVEGSFEGIYYIHTAATIYWPESGNGKLRKVYLKVKSYIRSFSRIYRNRKEIDIIQVCTNKNGTFYFYRIVSKICGLKYVSERSELPVYVKKAQQFRGIRGKIVKAVSLHAFKFFDGWILETQNLADYYLNVAKKGAKCCIVPMTVEEDRFAGLEKQKSDLGRYVGYCGNMREADGVSILIRAFAQIASKYPNTRLVLAGSSSDVAAQKKLAAELGISDRVVFLGRLSRNEVPQFITNAEVLALASPLSIRASATMPCKVGEYMCTANPVVVTGQGEIFKYLRDGENSYLAQPDNIEDFASKLDYVLSHPGEAAAVGCRGRMDALDYFGSATQAKRIAEFYKSL